MKEILRTVQTYLPGIRPAKFGFYNFGTRHFGIFTDPEFRLLSHLAPIGLALDLGGNWGQSIEAFRRFGRPDRIISFEPNPELSSRLKRRHARDPRVSICSVALSENKSSMTLYIPSYNGYIFDGIASLNRDEAENWLEKHKTFRFDKSKLKIIEHTVSVVTLDSFDLNPQVIKIDIQGYEAAAIRGGMETFRRSRPATIVEAPSEEVKDLLGEAGLKPYSIVNGRLSAGLFNCKDVLFLHEQHVDRMKATIAVPSKLPASARTAGL